MDLQNFFMLQQLKPKQRDELLTRVLLSGETPSVEAIKEQFIAGSVGTHPSMPKTSAGKAYSEAMKVMRMCGINQGGGFDPQEDPMTGLQVCNADPETIMLNFKTAAGRSFELMKAAVPEKYFNWSLYFLEELLVNWKENNVHTFQQLLFKLAALSTVSDDENFAVSYYPIDYEPFLEWLLKFYAPQEVQVTLEDKMIPALGTYKKQVAKYIATAVRREITDKMQITAQVAAAVKGNCEYRPEFARGGVLPPFDPQVCMASVRMGQDFRMYYAKPDISRTGQIKSHGARWEVLSPKMKSPTLLQVLTGAEYKTKHEQEEEIKDAFAKNFDTVMTNWQTRMTAAIANQDFLALEELQDMNPMDSALTANEQLKLMKSAKVKAANKLEEINFTINELENLGDDKIAANAKDSRHINNTGQLFISDPDEWEYLTRDNATPAIQQVQDRISLALFGGPRDAVTIDGKPALTVFVKQFLKGTGVMSQDEFDELKVQNKWLKVPGGRRIRSSKLRVKKLSGPDIKHQLQKLTESNLVKQMLTSSSSDLTQTEQQATLMLMLGYAAAGGNPAAGAGMWGAQGGAIGAGIAPGKLADLKNRAKRLWGNILEWAGRLDA
jgi:hypothetical protein